MSVTLDYELLNLVSSKGIDKLKELAYLGIVLILILCYMLLLLLLYDRCIIITIRA